MKGGLNILTKREAKTFLNVCRSVDTIKFNQVLKHNNISQPSISRFMNSDDYDDFISINNLTILCDELYNTCGFIVDMYREIILHEKIV